MHFSAATYVSQAISSKCKIDAPQIVYITKALTKCTVQTISTIKILWIINASSVIVSGIDTVPTKRSVKARPDSRIFEFFLNFPSRLYCCDHQEV